MSIFKLVSGTMGLAYDVTKPIHNAAYEYARKRQMEDSDPLGKDILHGEQEVFYDVYGNRIHASDLNYNNNISEERDPDFYLKYGDAGGEIEVIDDIIKQANSQERTDLPSKLYYKKGEEYILAIGGRDISINTPLYISNGENLYSSANITYGEAIKQGKIKATTVWDRMDRTNPDNQISNLNHLNDINKKRVEILANGGEEAGKEFIERADIINKAKEREQAAEQARTGDMPTAPETPEPKTIFTFDKNDLYEKLFDFKDKLNKENLKVLKEIVDSYKSETGKINYAKKVSLNVAPVTKLNVANGMSGDEWEARAGYVLGDSSGLLYKIFHDDWGIVFPYTPKVDFEHSVNYERTEIMHSNLAVSHYKNTPPPSITIQADFTADGEDNARYMFGVIHFLRSISKCEFGETMLSDKREKAAGVPPPILYLNGYGNFMNNIPVVVQSFGISFDKNKHYVHLSSEDVWLPTDITISIKLEIQFNLEKYKLQFDLNEYKKNTLGYGIENLIGKTKVASIINVKGTETIYTDERDSKIIESKNSSKYISEDGIKNVRLNGSGWTW